MERRRTCWNHNSGCCSLRNCDQTTPDVADDPPHGPVFHPRSLSSSHRPATPRHRDASWHTTDAVDGERDACLCGAPLGDGRAGRRRHGVPPLHVRDVRSRKSGRERTDQHRGVVCDRRSREAGRAGTRTGAGSARTGYIFSPHTKFLRARDRAVSSCPRRARYRYRGGRRCGCTCVCKVSVSTLQVEIETQQAFQLASGRCTKGRKLRLCADSMRTALP